MYICCILSVCPLLETQLPGGLEASGQRAYRLTRKGFWGFGFCHQPTVHSGELAWGGPAVVVVSGSDR